MRFRISLFTILSFLFSFNALAQCPVAANCTPGAAPTSVHAFGMGIFNVTVGSGVNGFSNSTAGVADGYQDYSCTRKAILLEGVSTPISITTNPNANENVRVWLDLNNDGVFNATSELVFSSVNAKTHTGNITIPVSAAVVKNTVLRLRVSADNFSSSLPTPCSTPAYSQVEDYGITVVPNTQKPAVDFTVNNPVTCSPTVQFTNLVQNGATSYLWDFGDNTTSTLANPSKTFAATGTYTIKLTACNANGCDSLTKIGYITYHTNLPVPASCTPATLNYCCNYGINIFNLHSLTNTSQDARVGYEDFTCTKSVSLSESNTYPVSIIAYGQNPQDARIYIDYNNNGTFEVNELVFTKLGTINPAGNFTVPAGVVKNTPLRLRVIVDSQGNPGGPCTSPVNGQAEDYTVIILPNTSKPVSRFVYNYLTACDTVVQFTDNSLNFPTSWQWDFGDGSAGSTQQNPQHTYANSGSYTVKLKACNANGCDSVASAQPIYIWKLCPQYCMPTSSFNNHYISQVTFNTLSNTTAQEPNGYGNYTHLSTTVMKGISYNFTGTSYNPSSLSNFYVWIDYNQDGDFEDGGELVCSSNSSSINRSFRISNSARLGPTRMRVGAFTTTSVSSCKTGGSVAFEDYTINITPRGLPPIASFTTFNRTPCNNTVTFADTSLHSPETWLWDFGDPASGAANTSTLSNPSHTFTGSGFYTITLTVCNPLGCSTVSKNKYINIIGSNGPKEIACRPKTLNTNPNNRQGVYKVEMNTINFASPGGNGYEDYSCTQQTTLEQGSTVPFTIYTGPNSSVFPYFDSNLRIWIDFNNNAVFEPVSELVYASPMPAKVHTGTITIPATAVLHTALRMRIFNESTDNPTPGPCDPPIYGQVEDYAVTIVPASGKPVASFQPGSYSSCNPQVSFLDQSTATPTSWTWNFGDLAAGTANTSNLKDPTHTFTGPGNYPVTLTVCNAAGCHTTRKIVSIIAAPATAMICPVTVPPNVSGEGIMQVQFLNVDQASGNSSEGYKNFMCTANAVTTPGTFLVNVQTNPARPEHLRAFIDFNNDGIFSGQAEEVMSTYNTGWHSALIVVPANAVKNTWLRFRFVDLDASLTFNSYVYACGTTRAGQAEDYALMVRTQLPVLTNIMGREEKDLNPGSKVEIYPNPSNGTFSLRIPSVLKGSYQLEVQNMTGQTVAKQALKVADKEVHQLNLEYLPKGVYLLRIYNEERAVVKKLIIE